MANQGCIDHIHKMRNILSEIYLRKGIKKEEIELMDTDRLKHELERLWVTCLNCNKGDICGGKEE